MLKSIYLLGLASAVALGFTSLPAHADQLSEQVNDQSAAAVGADNHIYQDSTQVTVQEQIRKQTRKSGDFGSQQDAYQLNRQSAGAVGDWNRIDQKNTQVQTQREVHQQLHYPSSHRY